MKANRYLGGVLAHGGADRVLRDKIRGVDPGDFVWLSHHSDGESFLWSQGASLFVSRTPEVTLLIRGYVTGDGRIGVSEIAQGIRERYLRTGDLQLGDLEGCFSLVLLDGRVGRVFLYRNLVGSGFVYYTESSGGFIFGSNLADLVSALEATPPPNVSSLPAFFIYRWVPGRETLFHGVFRVLPGELVRFDASGLHRSQKQTLGSLAMDRRVQRDPVGLIDEAMHQVITDCVAKHEVPANLLSGGVDSSYIQTHLKKTLKGPVLSISISVNHPSTRSDDAYALSAAEELGSRHAEVKANGAYADYMVETISRTGEPLNHVQAAYIGHAAREIAARGISAALCGEGADGVFGLGTSNFLHNAEVLRWFVPTSRIRGLAAKASVALGLERLAWYFRLANHYFDSEYSDHPVNTQAAFTDWPSVHACFGEKAVRVALASRRRLIDEQEIGADVVERLHAANFLTDSMDSASLWSTIFDQAGCELFCPFLDSRLLRVAASLDPRQRFAFRRPKELLKKALARNASHELAHRKKRGFGQPIFEWLAEGGQLRSLVDAIGDYAFVEPKALERARATPNWFLYSLVVYDQWHKIFIERSSR